MIDTINKYIFPKEKSKVELVLDEALDTYRIKVTSSNPVKGSYGHIYYGKYLDTDEDVVIKIFDEDITSADVINEISCIQMLHPYETFPKLHHIIQMNHGEIVAIVMNYCGKIMQSPQINGNNKVHHALNFFDAYNSIYRAQILHRDIKSNNICLDANGRINIIDFGYSRITPFVSNQMSLFKINQHIELLESNYNVLYSSKSDLLSIYNMCVYIFSCMNSSRNGFNFYPVHIVRNYDQVKNLVYLLLHKVNNEARRKQIYLMVNKFTGDKYFRDEKSFHREFYPNPANQCFNVNYRNLVQSVPKFIYIHLKKFLCINPAKRISFGSFYHRVQKELPESFMRREKKCKLIFDFDYDKRTLFLTNVPSTFLFGTKFDHTYDPKLYALSVYRAHKLKLNAHTINDVYYVVRHVTYATSISNIFDDHFGASINRDILKEYINKMNLMTETPYIYYRNIHIYRKTPINSLLFDYFVTILSTHPTFVSLNPYILASSIAIIIYRIYRKVPIQIDIIEEQIVLLTEGYVIDPICLTKKTMKLFLACGPMLRLINKMYGYYALLYLNGCTKHIDEYYHTIDPKVTNRLRFFQSQARRALK